MSWNLNGLGEEAKKRWAGRVRRRWKTHMFLFKRRKWRRLIEGKQGGCGEKGTLNMLLYHWWEDQGNGESLGQGCGGGGRGEEIDLFN